MLEQWKEWEQVGRTYSNIMDENVWRAAKAYNGTLFFDSTDQSGDLHIGVMMNLDW